MGRSLRGSKGTLQGLPHDEHNGIIHTTGTVATGVAATGVALTCATAILAALRFVCKTFFSIKFLLAGSKRKFLSAIFADQGLVFVHGIPL